MYHELIRQTLRYVHATTTILCSYCNNNNFDSIKHAADKIVTDGVFLYTCMLAIHETNFQ